MKFKTWIQLKEASNWGIVVQILGRDPFPDISEFATPKEVKENPTIVKMLTNIEVGTFSPKIKEAAKRLKDTPSAENYLNLKRIIIAEDRSEQNANTVMPTGKPLTPAKPLVRSGLPSPGGLSKSPIK